MELTPRASLRVIAAIAGGSLFAGLGGGAACILADPPAALPVVPIQPPSILRESAVPPQGLLTSLPPQFLIPVAVDTRETGLVSQLFVDRVAATAPRTQGIGTDGGVLVPFDDPPSFVAVECHTLEVQVRYPDWNAGDSISWTYSETGDFTNCPVFDAGSGDAGDASVDAHGGTD